MLDFTTVKHTFIDPRGLGGQVTMTLSDVHLDSLILDRSSADRIEILYDCIWIWKKKAPVFFYPFNKFIIRNYLLTVLLVVGPLCSFNEH